MKLKALSAIFLTLSISTFASASCESVIAEIKQKIINNGVPEDHFSVVAVPNAEAGSHEGKIVGHCENESHKIIYTKK